MRTVNKPYVHVIVGCVVEIVRPYQLTTIVGEVTRVVERFGHVSGGRYKRRPLLEVKLQDGQLGHFDNGLVAKVISWPKPVQRPCPNVLKSDSLVGTMGKKGVKTGPGQIEEAQWLHQQPQGKQMIHIRSGILYLY